MAGYTIVNPIADSVKSFGLYSVISDRVFIAKYPTIAAGESKTLKVPTAHFFYGKIKQFRIACAATKFNAMLYSDVAFSSLGANYSTSLQYTDANKLCFESNLQVYAFNKEVPEVDEMYIDITLDAASDASGEIYVELVVEDLDEK